MEDGENCNRTSEASKKGLSFINMDGRILRLGEVTAPE